MYKVLIIDDETLAIRYLSSLIDWEAEGFDRPLTALSVSRAVELFSDIRVDIVITDVRMPETDGVTLARKLREINPDFKCIVLTAYRDFEVVQRSVELGISSFLLKHELDAGILKDALRKALEQLADERRLRRAALSHWLGKRFSGSAPVSVPRIAGTEAWRVQLLIIAAAPLGFLRPEAPSFILPDYSWPIFAQSMTPGGIYCLLRQTDEGGSAEPSMISLPRNAVTVFLPPCTLENLQDGGIIRHLASHLLIGGPTTMTQEQYASLPSVSLSFPQNYVEKAVELYRIGSDQLSDWVLAPFSNLPDQGACEKSDLAPLQKLLAEFFRLTEEQQEDFGQCASLSQALVLLEKMLKSIPAPSVPDDAADTYARRAAEIIRKRYGEDLRTADIAAQLFISDGYLRSVFKQYHGCTVSEYLRSARIEAACELLRSKDRKAYEVAEMCGFKSSQHFNQVFRQEKGMSPMKYAQIHSND
ncbi:MAG: response regulator [Clostridia bacterium]|nr:response regulator [Clostridia bacterium]